MSRSRYPLNSLGRQIKEHWRQFRPKDYRRLEQAGKLDEHLYQLQERHGNTVASLVSDHGLNYDQAWELARESSGAFPPSEEEDDERDGRG